MARYIIEKTTLDAIARAIRGKSGKTELITPLKMVDEINSLQIKPTGVISQQTLHDNGDGLVRFPSEIKDINQIVSVSWESYDGPNLDKEYGVFVYCPECNQEIFTTNPKLQSSIDKGVWKIKKLGDDWVLSCMYRDHFKEGVLILYRDAI